MPLEAECGILFRLVQKTSIEIGRTKKSENDEAVLYIKVGNAERVEMAHPDAKENFEFFS